MLTLLWGLFYLKIKLYIDVIFDYVFTLAYTSHEHKKIYINVNTMVLNKDASHTIIIKL